MTVWSGTSDSNVQKLFTLQKKAVRHICFASFYDHTSKLFASLSILKFPDLIHVHIAMFAYCSVNSYNPPVFNNYFTPIKDIHSYNTRQAWDMHKSRPRSNIFKQCLWYRANTIWNSLSNAIKHHPSLYSFKHNLSNHCLKSYC